MLHWIFASLYPALLETAWASVYPTIFLLDSSLAVIISSAVEASRHCPPGVHVLIFRSLKEVRAIKRGGQRGIEQLQQWATGVQQRVDAGETTYWDFLVSELGIEEDRASEIFDEFGLSAAEATEIEAEEEVPDTASAPFFEAPVVELEEEVPDTASAPFFAPPVVELEEEVPDTAAAPSFAVPVVELEEAVPDTATAPSFAAPAVDLGTGTSLGVRPPPQAKPRPKKRPAERFRDPAGDTEEPSSSSCVRRLVPPPQPLRPVYCTLRDEFEVYFWNRDQQSFVLATSGILRLGRPSGRHLAVDYNWVLNAFQSRRIRPGELIHGRNIEVLAAAQSEHPDDKVVIVSQVESAQLKANLLDTIRRTAALHPILHLVATTPRKTGPLGKASFLRALSGNVSDWVIVDDNLEVLQEVAEQGGRPLHVWVRGREFGPNSLPWCTGLSEAGSQISELRNQNY